MRQIYITLLTFVLATSTGFITPLFGQYYIELEKDASGFDTAPFQADLNAAAQELCQLFDSLGFEGQFKVFSAGFYTEQEFYGSFGYPGAFDSLKTKAAAESPYYLLIGRESNSERLFDRFFIDLLLPDTSWFECTNKFSKSVIQSIMEKEINSENTELGNNPILYSELESNLIKEVVIKIRELAECCVPSNKTMNCTLNCPVLKDIKNQLLERGFVGSEVNISGSRNPLIGNTVFDYSGLSVNSISVRQKMLAMIQDLTTNQLFSAKGYVTDNYNICSDNNFDLVDSLYNEDRKDYDIWIHIFQSSESSVPNMVFVKCEQYILLDDERFIAEFEEAVSTAQSKSNNANNLNGFLMIDPQNMAFYHTALPGPLPTTFETAQLDNIIFPPIHIVEGINESLTSIVEEYGGFTISDLKMWNPQLSGYDANAPLMVLSEVKIYVDEFNTMATQENTTFGLVIPVEDILSRYLTLSTSDEVNNYFGRGEKSGTPVVVKPIFPKIPPELIDPGKLPPDEVLDRPTPQRAPKNLPSAPPRVLPWYASTIATVALVVLAVLLPLETGSGASPALKIEGQPIVDPRQRNTDRLKYVTYTKTNMNEINAVGKKSTLPFSPSKNGKVYVGRTRGYGNPQLIVWMRDKQSDHIIKTGEGYSIACLDEWTISRDNIVETRHSDPSYQAIRGREQNIIDMMGDAWVWQPEKNNPLTGDPYSKNTLTRSGNAIRGMDKLKILAGINLYTPYYYICSELAHLTFPNPVQGESWDGHCPN
jgi:hypothetical protein